MITAGQCCDHVLQGKYDAQFSMLYGLQQLAHQRKRYADALRAFIGEYGPGRPVSLYSAPGRTEIGGNHTDHNNGLVMAAAVDLDIIAVVSVNGENIVRVRSAGFGRPDHVNLDDLTARPEEKGCSSSLIRGVAAGIVNRGGAMGGFDTYTTSAVLRGSGLSSSAAFEVCMACIFNEEYNEGRFSAVELGMIGQYAENDYFGKPSGLMDQTACAVGDAITIDLKDPAAPVVQKVPFDLGSHGYHLVITDTKGSHANLTDEYAAIRNEMEAVAAYFGKEVLRDVHWEAFCEALPLLRERMGDRALLRSLHFFAECKRVPALAAAIQSGNMKQFLALVLESGYSSVAYNQNAYSVKNPAEQGIPLGLALSQNVLAGKGAWRLQGGGFAGTIQAFVPNELLEPYCQTLEGVFGSDACHVLQVRSKGCIRL